MAINRTRFRRRCPVCQLDTGLPFAAGKNIQPQIAKIPNVTAPERIAEVRRMAVAF